MQSKGLPEDGRAKVRRAHILRKRGAGRPARLSAGFAISAIAGIVMLVPSCGDGAVEPAPSPTPVATTVVVSPTSATLTALEEAARFTAEVRDQNGQVMAGAAIAWATSDASVAAVDGSGVVTSAANGTATITATAGSVSGAAAVTVAQVVSAVAVSPSADTLVALGDSVRLVAEATDANGHGAVAATEFVWASSDTAVASVGSSGLVTAAGNGSATITASAGSASGSAVVAVVLPPAPVPADSLSVRTVYAIPRNREFVQAYSDSVGAALHHLQVWYRDQMDGLTFALADTIPDVCRLSVRDDFLTVHPGGAGERWDAALEAVSGCGPKHNDEAFIWIVYFDVDEPCWTEERPQTLGRGGDGLTMLGRWDLLGLTDRGNSLPCGHGGQPHGRWVGGLGHELGHAFGLPHPPGCEAGAPTCDEEALMWVGYAWWPDTYLRDDERAILRGSPFFEER